jgi:hypothetical protein
VFEYLDAEHGVEGPVLEWQAVTVIHIIRTRASETGGRCIEGGLVLDTDIFIHIRPENAFEWLVTASDIEEPATRPRSHNLEHANEQ